MDEVVVGGATLEQLQSDLGYRAILAKKIAELNALLTLDGVMNPKSKNWVFCPGDLALRLDGDATKAHVQAQLANLTLEMRKTEDSIVLKVHTLKRIKHKLPQHYVAAFEELMA